MRGPERAALSRLAARWLSLNDDVCDRTPRLQVENRDAGGRADIIMNGKPVARKRYGPHLRAGRQRQALLGPDGRRRCGRRPRGRRGRSACGHGLRHGARREIDDARNRGNL